MVPAMVCKLAVNKGSQVLVKGVTPVQFRAVVIIR